MASSSKWGEEIPPSDDIAGIKRKPKAMAIYTVVDDSNKVEKYILPIYGKGLWSTLYGFVALDKDLRTIKGFTFYQHGETPGLVAKLIILSGKVNGLAKKHSILMVILKLK